MGVHIWVSCVCVYTSESRCARVYMTMCWWVYVKAALRGRQRTCVYAYLRFWVHGPSPLALAGRDTGRIWGRKSLRGLGVAGAEPPPRLVSHPR